MENELAVGEATEGLENELCFVYVVLLISLEKNIASVGLSYKDVILFSNIFYVLDVVYLKSNSIT